MIKGLSFLPSFLTLGYAFGMRDEVNTERRKSRNNVNGYKVVAAGNPAMNGHKKKELPMLPASLTCDNELIETGSYDKYIVDAMYLEGINNSDVLLSQPLSKEELRELGFGQFIIIQVDEEYYKAKKRHLEFDAKLRKTLMQVPLGMTDADILKRLQEIDPSALLPENQKQLRQKYDEIKSYYHDCDLMLSKTYREGSLRYSFHPVDLILSKVAFVVKYEEDKEDKWNTGRV